MKNQKYNILLSHVLLLPFIKKGFNNKDALLEYAQAYDKLIDNSFRDKKTRKQIKDSFSTTKEAVVKSLIDDDRWLHVDDILRLLDEFYPAYQLRECLSDDKSNINKFYIEYIKNISRVFITFRDGLVAIRNWSKNTDPFLNDYNEYEKIDLWNQISRIATTDLFIAAAYVNFDVSIDNIFKAPNLVYLADMPLKFILSKGVAETHMHANAGVSYSSIWETQMLIDYTDKTSEIWFCTFFRLLSAIYINSNLNYSFHDFIFENKDPEISSDWFIKYLQDKNCSRFSSIEVDNYRSSIKKAFDIEIINDKDILFSTIYCMFECKGVSAEILWYYNMINRLSTYQDDLLCKCFLDYIRIKNAYFADKIQDTRIQGLDYFQEVYDRATGTELSKGPKKFYSIFEEQCKTGNLKLLEMKISPKIDTKHTLNKTYVDSIKRRTLSQIQQITKAYKSYMEDQRKLALDLKPSFPSIGLVYHFIKKEDPDNYNGATCIINDHSDSLNCIDYNTMRKNSILFLDALKELLEEFPLLTEYVVGIDAAAVEHETEPWVFAPVFRQARSCRKIIPCSNSGKYIQNIGFTYHVGEDFRHIVSGLRHIDEVLTHFDYRSGDRLGHAIALGVNIDELVARQGTVAIPIMEHLENLLWMWKYVNISSDIEEIPNNLEFMIMEMARKIYNDEINGVDAHFLWRVYQKKFEEVEPCKDKFIKNGKCILLDHESSDSGNDTMFNKFLCSHFCPCYYERYKKPIFVSMNDNVQFYKELQKSLIKKVERMGIYVETNPSSNAAIGDISSILEHPILRLNNRGLDSIQKTDSCVLTTINSDDPLVFSTFVENEIAYIYYALLSEGCKREEALEWIDKIRLHGINSSFIKNKKNFYQMKNDFKIIANYKL